MDLLTERLKERLPLLYSQTDDPDPVVLAKFFTPYPEYLWYDVEYSWYWYVIEGQPYGSRDYLFFGYKADVGHEIAELGYFTLREIEKVPESWDVEIVQDPSFAPTRLSVVRTWHRETEAMGNKDDDLLRSRQHDLS